ncbi:MAG: response regulator transcription factor [Bacteroidales bacterium]|nr:response regulator transcription factor [Bacteroidales bacterium]
MIKVALVDEHAVICDALSALLQGVEDIEVGPFSVSIREMARLLPEVQANIVLAVLYRPNQMDVNDIKLLSERSPRTKILILSLFHEEHFILKLIRAGVKGHLSSDTDRLEIIEAIYTLRNGYEFYAKTITNLLLNSYLSDKNMDKSEKETRQKALSAREMEILRLFAEGLSNRTIADKLFISVRTVETHKNNIMKKINLKTTVDLVKFAIKNNIIELD